jgi:hypothetical protein
MTPKPPVCPADPETEKSVDSEKSIDCSPSPDCPAFLEPAKPLDVSTAVDGFGSDGRKYSEASKWSDICRSPELRRSERAKRSYFVTGASDSENLIDIPIETDVATCDESRSELKASGTNDRIATAVEPKRSADSPIKADVDSSVIEICACDFKASDSISTDENRSTCDSKDSAD